MTAILEHWQYSWCLLFCSCNTICSISVRTQQEAHFASGPQTEIL